MIYGLLGENGAGKSTLINILSNLTEPDSGSLLINGAPFSERNIRIKRSIGLVSQYNQLVEELNIYDYLKMTGLLFKMPKDTIGSRIDNLIYYFFGDNENLYKSIKNYSSGMKKKAALCGAFIHKPDILFLDEPFANLDPVSSDRLCKLITQYINKDRIIFLSSHDLLYVDRIVTHIGVLEHNKLAFNGTLDEFKQTGDVGKIEDSLLKLIEKNTEKADNTEYLI